MHGPRNRRVFRLLTVLGILSGFGAILWQTPWAQKLIYPMPHQDLILQYAKENDIDPNLVAAIIRNESKFFPRAESQVGAKGLMQLMPTTAQWIADAMGMPNYRPEQLYEPETNIRMGCWYLGSLKKEFKGKTHLIIAAYNGGRGNVREWLSTHQWSGDPQEIDQIPYKETREYVRKVLDDYGRYQKIYGAT